MSRTSRFAEFLRAAVAVRHKPVTVVDKYPSVLWWSDLPVGLDQVRSPLTTAPWPDDDPRWLVISRVSEPQRPVAPESCETWLDRVELDLPLAPPSLNQAGLVVGDDGVEQQSPPPLAIVEEWNRYLTAEWTPWARRAGTARQIKAVYQKVFALQQEIKGQADAFDLFVGVGLYESRTSPGQVLKRHLLAFPAEISLDERSGSLSVAPSGEFLQAKSEVDFLDSSIRARIQPLIESSVSSLAEVGPALSDRDGLGRLLKDFTHSLDDRAAYRDDLSAGVVPPGGAMVSFAPALILRPRSLRSLDELLTKIAKQANAGLDGSLSLSAPWRKMMETYAHDLDSEGPDQDDSSPLLSRTYFPLPSNEEQAKIVRSVTNSPGVVVQGPPGTGKSHTIANLISHYLAEGRRVLVTAQTAQALHVLRDKLPMELQQLCVSMLGESRRNDKELERSVQTILSRRLGFSSRVHDDQIAQIERDLVEVETAATMHERTLRDSRAQETETLEPVPGYRGTRAVIARRIRDERARFAFLKDDFPPAVECPIFPDGWPALAAYHRSLTGPVKNQLAKVVVEPPFTLEGALQRLRQLVTAREESQGIPPSTVSPLPIGLSSFDLEALGEWLQALALADSQESKTDGLWVADLRKELADGTLVAWTSLLADVSELNVLLDESAVARIVGVTIEGRSEQDARRDLIRLDDYFAAGGKARKLMVIKPAVIKETEWLATSVHIDGKAPSAPEEVHAARVALDGWATVRRAEALWPGGVPGSGSAQTRVAILRHRLALLRSMLALADSLLVLPSHLHGWVRAQLHAGSSAADLLHETQRAEAGRRLRLAEGQVEELLRNLKGAIGQRDVVPSLQKMVLSLEKTQEAEFIEAWSSLADDVRARAQDRKYLAFVDAVKQHAPALAVSIVESEGTKDLESAFADFESAWLHKRAAGWLDLILSKERVEAVGRAARAARRRADGLVGDLAAAKAWRHALGRIDEEKRGYLVAWQQAARNIPASGKSVFRKRAAARRYLDQCLAAIPAWVAPLNRLYETIEPAPGLFDIAIIDESSQCWLDSLILFYLAKQVIVVGDDKQISPTVVGVSDVVIADLVRTFLPDFNFGPSFTINSSLFDHAQRYLSEGVPLREHFRSVPEIIRFSNELCYSSNPLIPLRQVGRNRLEPLKLTYLADGLRQGDINDREAHAVVEAVVACDADSAYEDMDFGVICLQGDDQAERIQHLLLERLGPGVFEKRGLRCGNPYAFQGDERDVMFLSMVAAPNWNNASLTGSIFEQRFNVAMSRARDQAWLFHSVQENDLGPACLRRRVLEFFKQPADLSIHGTSFDVPSLQVIAQKAERATERPPVPFDSWFEVDVALALVARGYRLSAQVKVGKKSIDLVVEGDGARLAVECDGDNWHGPEHYTKDLFRQQQLERAEWRFARVRECLFYSDEAKAIQEVVDACEELGIDPGWERRPSPSSVMTAVDQVSDFAVDEAPWVEPLRTKTDEDPVDETPSDLGETAVATPPSLFSDTRSGTFTGYGEKGYPDPRHAPPATLREAVLDIVTTDGPLPKGSIYRLYRDGCPKVERASKTLRQQVNKAVYYLEKTEQIETRDEGVSRDPTEVVVKLRTQQWVVARSGGARTLDDVPLSELAAAMRRLWAGTRPQDEVDRRSRYKALAGVYGVQRFTEKSMERLRPAEEFAFRVTDDAVGPLFR